MAWTFVQKSAVQGNVTATTMPITLPGASTGSAGTPHLLVAGFVASQGTWTLPAGWVMAADGANSYVRASLAYSIDTVGGVTTATWTNSLSSNMKGFMAEFSASAGAALALNAAGTGTAGAVAQCTTSTTTPAAAGDLAICCFLSHFSAGTAITWTDPAGWTFLGSDGAVAGGNHQYMAYLLSAAAGTLSVLGKDNVASSLATGWTGAVATFTATTAGGGGLTITTAAMAGGTIGTAYGQTISATGGTPPYAWSLASGSLPPGLALSPSSGAVVGTPATAGTYSFTVRVTDNVAATTTKALSIVIGGGRTILRPPSGYGIFGAYPGSGNADPPVYEANVLGGTRLLGAYQRYWAVATSGAIPTADDITQMQAGRLLCVCLFPHFTAGTVKWSAITAGTYDVQLTAIANAIKAAGYPVMIGWENEMNLTTSQPNGTPAEYIASYQHVWTLISGITPLAIFSWTPYGAGSGATGAAQFYPGDSYVDWIGCDPYDPAAASNPQAIYSAFTTWLSAQSFGAGKPLGIFETGVDNNVADATEAAWIAAVPAALQSLGYQLWLWFNGGGTLGTTTITPGSLSATAMASIGASSFFSPPSGPVAGAPYPIGSNTSVAASATLVLPVNSITATGDAIVVGASVANATGVLPSSCADSQGNLYNRQANTSTGAYGSAMFVAESAAAGGPTTALGLSDTITVTYASASAIAKSAGAIGVPSGGPADISVTAYAPSGTPTTTPHVLSGTLAQPSEVIVIWEANGSAGAGLTWTPGLTQEIPPFQAPGGNFWSSMAAVTTSSVSSLSAGGTIGTAAAWAVLAISLKLGAPPAVTTASLPGGQAGLAYSQALTAAGGVSPYSWAVTAGSLPGGLSLAAGTGVISGTPAAAGTSSFTITVTDSLTATGSKALSIAVVPAALVVTTATLPDGTATIAGYSQTLAATGGTAPYTWSVVAGALPGGLTLTGATGVIAGTPAAAGDFAFTVRATDAAAVTADKALTIHIAAAPGVLAVTTASLPAATQGVAYSAQLARSGGVSPFTWAMASQGGGLVGGYAGTFFGTGIPSGFEGGAGNWTGAGNCNTAYSTAQANSGTGSLSLTSVAAGNADAASCTAGTIATYGMPVTPGDQIPVEAWFRAGTAGRACQVGAGFYTAGGALVSVLYDPATFTSTTTGWVQATGLVTVPATAAWARLQVRIQACAAGGEVHYVDDVQIGPYNLATEIAQWIAFSGRPLTVRRHYLGAGSVPTVMPPDFALDAARGTKICLTIRPAYNPVSSADRANLDTLLAAMAAAGVQADITLWHEPYYSGLTALQYVAMVQYYSATVRKYYPLACCFSGPDANASNGFYPGDAYVDKIAVDSYDYSHLLGNTEITDAQSIADSAIPPKPFGIWEFNGSTDPVLGQSQANVTAFFTYIQALFAARTAAGKPNADIMLFSSASSGAMCTALTSSGDYRWAPYRAMFDALNSVSAPSTLPAGLALAANGLIYGTPSGTGVTIFTVKVTDAASAVASQQLSINVAGTPLQITTTSLPNAIAGVSYTATLAATGSGTASPWILDEAGNVLLDESGGQIRDES